MSRGGGQWGGVLTSRPPHLVPPAGSRLQREAVHLPLVHAHRRGSREAEEQGRQKAGEHRQGEGEAPGGAGSFPGRGGVFPWEGRGLSPKESVTRVPVRLCSSLTRACTSSCPRSVWRRAAAWTSSSSPASTPTWPPWATSRHAREAPCTSTATSRYQENALSSDDRTVAVRSNATLVSSGGRGRRTLPARPEERRAEEHRLRRHHARSHQHR